jgi:hypothetical protein
VYYIYGIVDPTDNMIGYVGITSNTPQQRLVQHLRQDDRDKKGIKRCWLDGLLLNGYMPTVITLQTVDTVQDAQIAERWWIAHGQMIGWPLRNSSHLVRQVQIPDALEADDGADEIENLYDVCEVATPPEIPQSFPIPNRALTNDEVMTVRRMYVSGMSKNKIIARVWGGLDYKPKRLAWLNQALSEGGA